MSGHVNGTFCTFVRGKFPTLAQESEIWRVPGIDGYGVALTGLGDSAGTLRLVLYSNNLGLNLWAAALYPLQGQIVPVLNDFGDSTQMFIKKVHTMQVVAAVIPGSGVSKRGEIQVDALFA